MKLLYGKQARCAQTICMWHFTLIAFLYQHEKEVRDKIHQLRAVVEWNIETDENVVYLFMDMHQIFVFNGCLSSIWIHLIFLTFR